MKKLDLKFYARTHIRGISYMYNEKKSFMPIDIFKNQISVNFWTGDKNIEGLKKGTWLSGKSEFTGSERIAIRDRNDFDQVFKFALEAYKIAKEWYEVYMVKT